MSISSWLRISLLLAFFILALFTVVRGFAADRQAGNTATQAALEAQRLVDRGRYLATIGVCEACHTPPAVPDDARPADKAGEAEKERTFRTDPDWFKYLDVNRRMSGGVAFILRFSGQSSGLVVTSNITPDPDTGIGNWTDAELVEVLRSGKKKDGTYLFMFPPHSYYPNLADYDLRALVSYLRTLPPVKHHIVPRSLPFPNDQPAPPGTPPDAPPEGPSLERASYLINGLVGCRECHSYTSADGKLQAFVGGDPVDWRFGVFRLGPDLPLRQSEKGYAAWPYPGYAVLYAPNLTRFGLGGDLSWVSIDALARSIGSGVSAVPDEYGRPDPIEHVMMWHFYSQMSKDDVYSIARYVKSLRYMPHSVAPNLRLFGEDWVSAFKQVFGEPPSSNDRKIYGK